MHYSLIQHCTANCTGHMWRRNVRAQMCGWKHRRVGRVVSKRCHSCVPRGGLEGGQLGGRWGPWDLSHFTILPMCVGIFITVMSWWYVFRGRMSIEWVMIWPVCKKPNLPVSIESCCPLGPIASQVSLPALDLREEMRDEWNRHAGRGSTDDSSEREIRPILHEARFQPIIPSDATPPFHE